MTTKQQKEMIHAQWETCSSERKIKIASAFLKGTKKGTLSKDWWQYLRRILNSPPS